MGNKEASLMESGKRTIRIYAVAKHLVKLLLVLTWEIVNILSDLWI